MPLTHEYTLLCDDVRREDNGKLILIGLYTPHIVIPMLPMGFPSLSFVIAFTSDGPARHQIRAQLRHLETGHSLGELMGMLQHAQAGLGVGVLRFPNLIFTQAGHYNLVVTVEGLSDPIIFDFDVILHIAIQPPQRPTLPAG